MCPFEENMVVREILAEVDAWIKWFDLEYYDATKSLVTNGPTYIERKKKIVIWSRNGVWHREDGPAYMNGCTCEVQYWLFGREVSKEQFETPGFVDLKIISNIGL